MTFGASARESSNNKHMKEAKPYIIIAVIGILITFGLKFVWAKFVYHDIRCVWAECRIQVNP